MIVSSLGINFSLTFCFSLLSLQLLTPPLSSNKLRATVPNKLPKNITERPFCPSSLLPNCPVLASFQ
jgi:hypothetical protein